MSSSSPTPDAEDIFKRTSNRWLINGRDELQQRNLKFDISALKQVAVNAVDGATSVVNFCELNDGRFNKMFSVTMDNGQSVVARLPYHNIMGRIEKTVESEVATMEFARTRLELPIPRVLRWCSRPEATNVSSAYIIMEEVKGSPVVEVWGNLSLHQKCEIMDEVIKMKRKMASFTFPGYGSIYFHKAIEDHCIPIDDTYVLGPGVSLSLNYQHRDKINVSRGPWTSTEKYLRTFVKAEKHWIKEHARPELLYGFQHYPDVVRDPAAHIELLERIEKLIPHITMERLPNLTRPILWHPEFSAADIMISDDALAGTTSQIVPLLNWQHCMVGPLYLQATPDEIYLDSFKPQPDTSSLDFNYYDMKLMGHYFERFSAEEELANCYYVMSNKTARLVQDIVHGTFELWNGKFMTTRNAMLEFEEVITEDGTSFPSPTSLEERSRYREEYKVWSELQRHYEFLCHEIGVNTNGQVIAEDYEKVCLVCKTFYDEWILSGRSEDDWPFDIPDTCDEALETTIT
ncbi:hypothetical protein BDQ17DRAFT_1543368 [Cyathus striatus]|nr:hypothetical protein BDQ17DRAFT_1543368 [Cyathus striatus]